MTADLHAAITARIDELERELREMEKTPGLGVDEVDACTCGTSGQAPYGHEPGCGLEPGPVWTLIHRSLRGLAEDRDILARHDHGISGYCNGDIFVGQPCDEARSLARRHGIEVPS